MFFMESFLPSFRHRKHKYYFGLSCTPSFMFDSVSINNYKLASE